jgi:ABC-type lipoprotein export system ATPase subunit
VTSEPPLIEIVGLTKHYPADAPLRIKRLVVTPGDAFVLEGFDAGAAELLIHLTTGAAVPDEGHIRIAGRDTREITTDTEWLHSLDLFGLVTERAVLIGQLTTAANLALPMTLAIDPIPQSIRMRVDVLAREVGLAPARMEQAVSALSPHERIRLHLARALAPDPRVLLLEDPTATIPGLAERVALGAALRQIAETRGLSWLALTNDPDFARASGGRRLRLDVPSGTLTPRSFWQRLRSR